MKCLVTGSAGFIGSHLCEGLLQAGNEVLGIDNLVNGKLMNLSECINNGKFKFVNADICDSSIFQNMENNFDVIFHLAGMSDVVPSIENPTIYFNTNVMGTFNVANFALASKVKKLVYAASSSSYGIPKEYPTAESSKIDPQYPYALTKYMGEELLMHWAKVFKLPVISLRLFNVYGPRSRTSGTYGAVFGVFLAQKMAGEPLTVIGDGTQTRDFTFVSDVCNAFIIAANSEVSGEIFNVGSSNTYSINTLVRLIGGEVVNIPKRPGEPDCTFADITKIHTMLGWSPRTSFEEGVEIMLRNLDLWADAPVWNPESIELATKQWFKYLGKE
jgi:UDP-glucose 4-epimerase